MIEILARSHLVEGDDCCQLSNLLELTEISEPKGRNNEMRRYTASQIA